MEVRRDGVAICARTTRGHVWRAIINAGGNAEIRFSGVAAGASGAELLYAIDTDFVGGLFQYDLKEGYERRLYHRNQFRASDLSRHPKDATLAFAIQLPDGTARLATMSPEGRGFKEVTEGDAVDEAPSWAAGDGHVIVFQSAGVGRNQAGVRTSLSTYAIQRLDLDNNKMDMLVEDESTDALSPRMTADGSLYYIRRPYEPHGKPVSIWRVGLDCLLFPFRLLRALVVFFNFLSLMFTRKPLITSGGPPTEGPDQRFLMLWGRAVDAEKALRENSNKRGGPSLVPASWQLVKEVRMDRNRFSLHKCCLMTSVKTARLCTPTGVKVMHHPTNGTAKQIAHGKLIERVAAIPNQI